ncbi:MAG: cobalamin-dependent protein [Candidatus Nitrosocosmicus sp.]|nr:cobalamin-dependent protein [Candidatus Nitrosocosmicus sp.]MDN5868297.1 cobalamin-dependent protein [Candidatus Nitrosocosmicus sp.]
MAFIRVKKVKGLDYYYLVKSQWDPNRKVSHQLTLKYLGKASNVTINDIPLEYRNNPRILTVLASKTKEQQEKSFIIRELKEQVFDYLKNGDIDKIIKVAEQYKKQESLSEFYDHILKPVLYEIGNLWQQNKLDMGTEHVCSNFANKTIHIINRTIEQRNNKESILICTPEGEIHSIACNIIESVLLEKGFQTYNISPSIPSESVIAYMSNLNPSLVLISVTLLDNVGSATRLVKKISNNSNIPIMIGGQGINNVGEDEKRNLEAINSNVKVITDSTLQTLLQTVKGSIKDSHDKKIGNYEVNLIS